MKKSIESVEVVEVVESVPTLEQSIATKKSELELLLDQQKQLKDKIKELKLNDIASKKVDKELKAKEKAEKIAELIAVPTPDVKSRFTPASTLNSLCDCTLK